MSLKNPVTPPEIDPGTVRLVAQRLNHYAPPPGPRQFIIRAIKQRRIMGLGCAIRETGVGNVYKILIRKQDKTNSQIQA